MGDIPLGAFQDGVTSGVRGTWTASPEHGCLTMNRPFGGPASGNLSLCVESNRTDLRVAFATAESCAELYNQFAANAPFGINKTDACGAAVVTAQADANSSAVISMALSWYFPDRDYMGHNIGNFYANIWKDSVGVGQDFLSDIPTTIADIQALHQPIFDSSLPDWLSDTLLNSISHFRSAWHQRNGNWRQWEAYDCVNVDSIHNDGERHIPYIMFMPETTRSKMYAWAETQQSDGMVPEQLACGCTGPIGRDLDKGCGRIMSDGSSMFIVYLLELYRWSGDAETLKRFWPVAKRAAEWHMASAAKEGVPLHQCNTYDILNPTVHEQVSYNSAFHILAMRAAAVLAASPVIQDIAFANNCTTFLDRAQNALDKNQWQDRGNGQGYYSYSLEDNSSLMVDTFYPQVLAFTNGLGSLVTDLNKLQAHLRTEAEWNDGPYGLVVESTGYGRTLSHGVWQMGSPDWATLNINIGGMPVDEALAQPKKSLENWRTRMKDLWNIAGVADQTTGLASLTSHYGYFMTSWHVPLALSGQRANLPEGVLSFDPKVEAPWKLPMLLPGVVGSVAGSETHCFTLVLTVGFLELSYLRVSDCVHAGPAKLQVGEPVKWCCTTVQDIVSAYI